MKNKDKAHAAFNGNAPSMPVMDETDYGQHYGLTKREYFAGLAMQGFLSNPMEVQTTGEKKLIDFISLCSVAYADALLAALEGE